MGLLIYPNRQAIALYLQPAVELALAKDGQKVLPLNNMRHSQLTQTLEESFFSD